MPGLKFKVGDSVRIKTKLSDYYMRVGYIAEVTPFKEGSAMVKFSESELAKAKRAEQVLRARPTVHFYFRELDKA